MPNGMRFKRDWDFDPGNKVITLNDLDNDSETRDAVLSLLTIIVGTGAASDTQFDPTGTNLTATDVQAALAELDDSVVAQISAAVNDLLAGVDPDYDTLMEIAAGLVAKQDVATLDVDITALAEDPGTALGAYLETLGGGGGSSTLLLESGVTTPPGGTSVGTLIFKKA